MTIVTLPPYQTMMNPIIHVLKMLGSSATIEELNSEVIENIRFGSGKSYSRLPRSDGRKNG